MLDEMRDEPERSGHRRRSMDRTDESHVEKLSVIVATLQKEADRRVGLRSDIERRWIDDLRMYHGVYNTETRKKLKDNERSELLVNLVRTKTDAMSARLIDLLFPTDDRNWGIQPSPVPEMADEQDQLKAKKEKAEARLAEADEIGDDTSLDADSPEVMAAEGVAAKAQTELDVVDAALRELENIQSEATRRAGLMQSEIEDQLKACSYQAAARDMIGQACKIGTGVMKGPVIGDKMVKKWIVTENGYEMQEVQDLRPSFRWIDAWSYFPDPDCQSNIDGEGDFERHLLNRKGMRKLARRPDIDPEAVARVLKEGADSANVPSHMQELHSLTGDSSHQVKDRYQVWEYTGPIEPEDLAMIAEGFHDTDTMQVIDDLDLVEEIYVRLTFCNAEVLSYALHPMDSNEPIYAVYNLHKDETSPFGFGMPFILRDSQEALSTTWRMIMDNASISAGPQVVVDDEAIEPEDNSWKLFPFKIWRQKQGTTNRNPFSVHNITMNTGMLQTIVAMAKENMDETSSMPMIAQGEQGSQVTKTFQGMAMLMNAANVVFKQFVKNFDDDVTVPNIRRIYDFNMQFSNKDAIKGDFEVDARGSSVLVVREIQSNNLLMFYQVFGQDPDFKAWLKGEELMKQICRSMSLIPAEILRTKDQYDEEITRQNEQAQEDPNIAIKGQELEIKREEIAARVAISEQDNAARREVAQLNYQATMMKVTEELNQDELDRATKEAIERGKIDSGERKLAAEVAMAQRTGEHAGGSI